MWMLFAGDLRRRWLEIALGALAIALVAAALVAQHALTAAAEQAVHDLAHHLGKNMLVLPASTNLQEFYSGRYGNDGLSDAAPSIVRSSPLAVHIRSIEARLYGNVSTSGGPLILVGQDSRWPAVEGAEPALLGDAAARALAVEQGGTFSLGETTFRVLGVTDAPPDELETGVFVPLAAAQRVLGRPGKLSALRLGGCWCRVDVATLAGDVEKLLPGARALTIAGMLKAQKGSVATMQRYSGALDAAGLLLVAGLVAALVASQARRRVREIALLNAIGAPPAQVASLFTWEATLGGAVAGLAGWALAALATPWLGTKLVQTPVQVSLDHLLLSVAVAALASFFAAAVPSHRAARRDATVVLREG